MQKESGVTTQGMVTKRCHTVRQSGISVTYFGSERPFLASLIQLKPKHLLDRHVPFELEMMRACNACWQYYIQ